MGGRIKALVISHPDDDHYGGLRGILDDPKFGSLIDFEAVYHNGLFPRAGSGYHDTTINTPTASASAIRATPEL